MISAFQVVCLFYRRKCISRFRCSIAIWPYYGSYMVVFNFSYFSILMKKERERERERERDRI